jgi:hypothetical protein
MAVVSLQRIAQGRSGTADDKFDRSYEVVWKAITNDPQDGPYVVGNAVGLPARFAPYSYGNDVDLAALCRDLSVRQDGENRKVWIVTAKFSTKHKDDDNEADPLDRRVKSRLDFAPYQKLVTVDQNGDPIVNSAGDPYEVTVDDHRPVLVYQRNEESINVPLVIDYQNSVNADSWKGLSAGQGKLTIVYGEEQVENGTRFWPATYSIHIREEGWDFTPVDRGARIKLASGELIAARDVFQNVQGQVNLDGAGNRLAAGEDLVYLDPFQVYKRRAFSALGL